MSESIVKIAVGSLVTQIEAGPATDCTSVTHPGEIGIIVELRDTIGQTAIWSPLMAKILWPDGSIESNIAIASLQII